jgi:hypothetical protein
MGLAVKRFVWRFFMCVTHVTHTKNSGYQIHLALAGFALPNEVKDMALQNGITVLQRQGDVFDTHPA